MSYLNKVVAGPTFCTFLKLLCNWETSVISEMFFTIKVNLITYPRIANRFPLFDFAYVYSVVSCELLKMLSGSYRYWCLMTLGAMRLVLDIPDMSIISGESIISRDDLIGSHFATPLSAYKQSLIRDVLIRKCRKFNYEII